MVLANSPHLPWDRPSFFVVCPAASSLRKATLIGPFCSSQLPDLGLHLLVGVIPCKSPPKAKSRSRWRFCNRLGLLPHTQVEFELAGDHARIRKAQRASGGRG